jgi:hypothetical protein
VRESIRSVIAIRIVRSDGGVGELGATQGEHVETIDGAELFPLYVLKIS